MNKQNKFILYVGLGAGGAHLIFSILLSLLTSNLYHNRMINIRHVDFKENLHASLIAPFVIDNINNDERPKLLIAGSSFSWGYPFPKKETLSFHLQNMLPELKVVNMSVIGDNAPKTLGNLCLLKKLGVHVDTLIVEVNIANFALTKKILTNIPRCSYYNYEAYLDKLLPYSNFFLSNPFGLKHFDIIHDEFDYSRKHDRNFRFRKVRDGYFNNPEEAKESYDAKTSVLHPIYETSKHIANRVIFYFSPVNTYGVSLSQYKIDDIKFQINSLLTVCREFEGIECLRTNFDLDTELFMNLTHLNMKGNKYFAEYLADIVNRKQNLSLSANRMATAIKVQIN